MEKDYIIRTLQWIVIIFLVFAGPLGWVLIYLLWKQWNPTSTAKSAKKAAPKVKKAAAKAPAKKKSTKK